MMHRKAEVCSSRPIGVFDSGLGGLSIWRALRARLPHEHLLYLADQAHVPYGSRPPAQVERLSRAAAGWLIGQGCKLVVVACNTATAVALDSLRAGFPHIPFVGLEPAIKPAGERTRTGRVGVMATPGTLAAARFDRLLERFAEDVTVYTRVCPGLVEAVEAGCLDGPEISARLRAYLNPLVEAGIDHLVLGCTHYPFLAPVIQEVVGPRVTLIDPAPAVARQVDRVLASRRMHRLDAGPADDRFATTGVASSFALRLTQLLGIDRPFVEHVEPLRLVETSEPPRACRSAGLPSVSGEDI
ncbi:MAG: glutamate racemase [Caldilineae bacterium]|nr:MAG: glutamate racemase [Caldilineae bacterium]